MWVSGYGRRLLPRQGGSVPMRDQNAATSQIFMAIIIPNPPVLPYSVTGYRDFIIHDRRADCKGKNKENHSFRTMPDIAENLTALPNPSPGPSFPDRSLQILRLVVYCNL